LRWQTARKKDGPAKAVRLAMKNEVGQLAADEAKPVPPIDSVWECPLLYTEPDPPGRDVYSVYSPVSSRLLQVAYHAHRREHILAGSILPTLVDLPVDRAAQWSIFDLNCVIPGGMNLKSHRLNAGDLGLTFADRFNEVTIRQIAVAQLALARQSLDAWIADQQKTGKRHHQPAGKVMDCALTVRGRDLAGRVAHADRRWRYRLMWNLPRSYFTIGMHDPERDRLILLHGTDELLLRAIAATVGSL
jgi:hypothetical protein